ncbi:hypothetical protein C8R44DRAFT_750311 [Mycena epipterygia]|nr:hypothetical protein C8R44DRAFT_750311 [Mycena epipterygia]
MKSHEKTEHQSSSVENTRKQERDKNWYKSYHGSVPNRTLQLAQIKDAASLAAARSSTRPQNTGPHPTYCAGVRYLLAQAALSGCVEWGKSACEYAVNRMTCAGGRFGNVEDELSPTACTHPDIRDAGRRHSVVRSTIGGGREPARNWVSRSARIGLEGGADDLEREDYYLEG